MYGRVTLVRQLGIEEGKSISQEGNRGDDGDALYDS